MSLDIALLNEFGRKLGGLVVVVLFILLAASIDSVQRRALAEADDGRWDPLKQVGGADLVLVDEAIEFAARGKNIRDLLRSSLALKSTPISKILLNKKLRIETLLKLANAL